MENKNGEYSKSSLDKHKISLYNKDKVQYCAPNPFKQAIVRRIPESLQKIENGDSQIEKSKVPSE